MDNRKSLSLAAGTVGSMTLLSRIFGFLRDMAIATMFGSSAAADAFFVAFRIPNLQRRLLGEGAMNAAFIPIFTEYMSTGREPDAWDFAARLFNILSVLLTGLCLLLVFLAPGFVAALAPGFLDSPQKFELTVSLTRWMAPYLVFVGLAALCMGILNARDEFALSAAAPVLLNMSMIGAAVFISPRMREPIYGLAIGVLGGGFLQLAAQLPAVMRSGLKLNLLLDWRHAGIFKVGKLMLPAMIGIAGYEINIVVDTLMASLLPDGSVSYLYYGNRLVQLPLGVFGVALGVAILPALSRLAARGEMEELRETLSFGIRLILFITLPATIGLILLRFPIVNTLWERGEFDRASTDGVAIALMYFAVGLCAFAGVKVITAAYFSLQDTKTPTKIGVYALILNIALNLALMGPLRHGGLALATSIASIANCAVLIYLLKRRLGRIGGRRILRSFGKLCAACAAMSIVIYFYNMAFFDPAASLQYKLSILLSCIALGLLAFTGVSHLLRNDELAFLRGMIKRQKPAPHSTG